MIQARDIHKSFGTLEVLRGVCMEAREAEVLSIVGPSGAGKTTFLQILGSLERPTSGEILIDGTDIFKLNETDLAAFRNRRIGFVFQFNQLLPEFTALENVCIPAFIARTPADEARKKAAALLDFLGLSHRLRHKPAALSGGEQQRVAMARALINNPAVLLADEPSGNLDSQNKQALHHLLFQLRDQFHQTILIVTHDAELAAMCDRSLHMVDGVFV